MNFINCTNNVKYYPGPGVVTKIYLCIVYFMRCFRVEESDYNELVQHKVKSLNVHIGYQVGIIVKKV